MEQQSKKNNSRPPKKAKLNKNNIYFTIFVLAWATLSTIAGQFVAAGMLSLFLGKKISQPSWVLLYYVISYVITLTLIIFIPPRLIKVYREKHYSNKHSAALQQLSTDLATTPTDLGVQKMPTFTDIGLAPIGYVVYLFFARIATTVMSGLFSWFDLGQEQNVGFSYFASNIDQIFAMLAVVFVAPIAEELIMRGWLYGKVRSKVKNIPIAIILVSLLFAILHGQWNVGVTVFVLSIVLCTLREVTGTIWAGMLLHMLSNGIAFYLVYIAGF